MVGRPPLHRGTRVPLALGHMQQTRAWPSGPLARWSCLGAGPHVVHLHLCGTQPVARRRWVLRQCVAGAGANARGPQWGWGGVLGLREGGCEEQGPGPGPRPF